MWFGKSRLQDVNELMVKERIMDLAQCTSCTDRQSESIILFTCFA